MVKRQTVGPAVAVGTTNYTVRDRQGRTHLEEGFTLENCKPVLANSIEHTGERRGPDVAGPRLGMPGADDRYGYVLWY
jgi:hypothetical protein